MNEHIYKYNYYKKGNTKIKPTSIKILEFGDYKIELLESVWVENEKELRQIEGRYQQLNINIIVNKRIENRTGKESFKAYRDKNKNKKKQYKQDNEVKINEYQKKYQKGLQEKKYVCDCGGKYSGSHKSTHSKTQKHQEYFQNKK